MNRIEVTLSKDCDLWKQWDKLMMKEALIWHFKDVIEPKETKEEPKQAKQVKKPRNKAILSNKETK